MTTTDSELETKSGMVLLTMPNRHGADPEHRENPLANLDFGPANKHSEDRDSRNIVFREVAPGVGQAIVRGDHPLLERLMEKYPQVRVGEEVNPTIYLCHECDDGREFGSKIGLRNHLRRHKTKTTEPDEE